MKRLPLVLLLFALLSAGLWVSAAEVDFSADVKITTGLLADEYAAGTYCGPVIDTRGFGRSAVILNAGGFASGATATVTIYQATEPQALATAVTAADVSTALRLTSTAGVKLAILLDGTSQTAPRSLDEVYVRMRRVGSPTGAVSASIEIQSTTTPSGTSLGNSAAVTIDAIATSYEWKRLQWSTAVPLVPSTTYFVVIQGNYTTSAANYIEFGVDTVVSGGNYYDYTTAWDATATKSIDCYLNGRLFSAISGAVFAKTADSIEYTGLNESTDNATYTGLLNCRGLYPTLMLGLVGETAAVTVGATVLLGGSGNNPITQDETALFSAP